MDCTINNICESPTQRTLDLFIESGRSYFYCESLKVWVFDDVCKNRHDMAVKNNQWAIDIGITEPCLRCYRYTDKIKPKMKQCKANICSCGQWFEDTPENFHWNTSHRMNNRCKKCNNKYMKMLWDRKKAEKEG